MRINEINFASIFLSFNVPICITDIKNNIIFINDCFSNTYQFKQHEIIGNNISCVIIDYIPTVDDINSQFKTKGDCRCELKSRKKDGNEFLVFFSISLHNNSFGNPDAIIYSAFHIKMNNDSELDRIHQESKFKQLYDNSPVGIVMVDVDDKILSINKSFENIFQYKSNEAIGSYVDELIVPQQLTEESHDLYHKALEGNVVEKETVRRRKDGSLIQVCLYGIPITVENKRIGFYAMYNDITERKRAEIDAYYEKVKFKQLYEISPIGLVMIDERCKIISTNKSFENIFQYSQEEILGSNIDHTIAPEQLIDEAKSLSYNTLSGSVVEKETVRRRKDGSLVHVHLYGIPIIAENKRIGFYAMYNDITARKRTEELLKLNEEKYRKIFENVQDVFYQTDRNGYIIEISPSISKFTGFKRDEMLNTHISRLYFEPENRNEFLNHLKVTGEVEDFETQIKTKYNKLIYASINAHFRYNDSKQIIGTEGSIRNINERKTAELELIKEKEKAEQSDKLKTEFLAQMSHEIRTPLNAMLNYSYYIMEEINEKTKLDISEFFEGMNRAGKRIIKTIESILSMSSIQVGSFENTPTEIDIYKEVLEHIYIDFHPLAKEKGLILSAEKRTDNTSVFVDGFVSTKIFENLLDNAIKFTKAGYVKIIVSRNESGNLIVEVSDSGIGISEEYLRKLFTPFSQEDQSYSRQYDGTGLGLALVKKYCDMNNILIDIQSKKGIGTQAVLTFPLN
jgi:PAS domain S-box-containing protein